jgi:hypothetical protein
MDRWLWDVDEHAKMSVRRPVAICALNDIVVRETRVHELEVLVVFLEHHSYYTPNAFAWSFF